MRFAKRFVQKFTVSIVAIWNCFDRVIFKGYLPFNDENHLNAYVDGVLRMRRKDFLPWLEGHSQRLVDPAKQLASEHGRPYEYRQGQLKKDKFIHNLIRQALWGESKNAQRRRRDANRVTRLVKRLHVRGLVAKIPRSAPLARYDTRPTSPRRDGPTPLSRARRCCVKTCAHGAQKLPTKTLTEEGVPTPDHGRYRTDNGVRHRTSGVWRQSTISNIARNPLLLAVVEHGRRSMDDQLRFTPAGPRELADEDRREDDRPKVIRNEQNNHITAPAKFDPLVDPDRHRNLIATLDKRGGTQRGKPRSRDPDKNPLGSRVFDMNCGWPMYREPYNGSFRYKCALYQQSHGAKCAHNHVDGLTAARFVLSCVRQRVLSPERLKRFEQRLRELAAQEAGEQQPNAELNDKRVALSEVKTELEKVTGNRALAQSPEQYKAVAAIFEQLKKREARLEREIAAAASTATDKNDVEAVIRTSMEIVHQLAEFGSNPDSLGAAGDVFRLVNARLFLGFRPVKVKKRTLNKTRGGVVTFGDDPPPIELYEGPTARRKVKVPAASHVPGTGDGNIPPPPESPVDSGREGKSLGNVSRGDWI